MIAEQATGPDTHSIQNLAGLAGRKVGVLTGSTYDGVLKKNNPQALPEYFNSFADQTEALKTGKIDGFLVDEPIARDILNHSSGMTTLKGLLTSDGYAFAFHKRRPDLQRQVNDLLRRMKADGTIRKLEEKWFGTNEAARVLSDTKPDGKNGVIRLATNGHLAPFVYIKDGKMIGYDIEIAMLIASQLGRRLEISDMDFSAIIPSLVSGKSDMGAGGNHRYRGARQIGALQHSGLQRRRCRHGGRCRRGSAHRGRRYLGWAEETVMNGRLWLKIVIN